MLVTIENVSLDNYADEIVCNQVDSLSGGSGPSALLATGGAVLHPLPYPFAHVGELGDGDSIQMPCHMRDFANKRHLAETFTPGEQWNQMVQAGIVTFTVADETTDADVEDQAIPVIA